jgi:hypothetical protein
MKTLVGVGKRSGDLCCLIPLFPEYDDEIPELAGFKLSFSVKPAEPAGYLVDIDAPTAQFFHREFVHEHVEILGEL